MREHSILPTLSFYIMFIDPYVLSVISSYRDAIWWKLAKTIMIRDRFENKTLVMNKVDFCESHALIFQRGSNEKNHTFHYPGITHFYLNM